MEALIGEMFLLIIKEPVGQCFSTFSLWPIFGVPTKKEKRLTNFLKFQVLIKAQIKIPHNLKYIFYLQKQNEVWI